MGRKALVCFPKIFCIIIIIVNPWLLLKLSGLLTHLLIAGEKLKPSETLKKFISINIPL